jgi:eukaryotic-like serine/threonine-protein kinase
MRQTLARGDPRRVGGYRIEARLGVGGMGVVYVAVGQDGDRVALKLVKPEIAGDEGFRRRFRREVQTLERVDGPFVARLVGAELDVDPPWLATEYVDGPTLDEHVRMHGPMPAQQVRLLGIGLLDALGDIHAAGVVHRDLSPRNVLLTADGPKVVDFGIAVHDAATTYTQTGTVVGTPAWMAPEQAEGDATTTATDIFSWGCVVAFAALGRPPFGEGLPQAVLYRVVHADPNLDDLDESLRPAVEASLAKDPASRPSRDVLVAQLSDATGVTETIEQTLKSGWTIPGLAPDGRQPARRRRVGAMAWTAAVVGIVGAGVAVAAIGLTRSDAPQAIPEEPPTTVDASADEAMSAADTVDSTVRTEPETTAAAELSPGPSEPESWYTTDGSDPALFPDCNGVFGLCLGSPIEQAEQMFGLELERYEGVEGLVRVWEVGPVRLSIEADDIARVVAITATIEEGEAIALGLPEGLVLGRSTMGDVKTQLGEPAETPLVRGEGIVLYTFAYRSGPEGSERIEFTYGTLDAAVVADTSDPGGFNNELDARPLTSFSVGYELARGPGP